jgi:hypothetical protein
VVVVLIAASVVEMNDKWPFTLIASCLAMRLDYSFHFA